MSGRDTQQGDDVSICERCGKDHDDVPFRVMLACVCDLSPEDADVYTERIADRLAGYSHDEVVEMHPLPSDPEAGRS